MVGTNRSLVFDQSCRPRMPSRQFSNKRCFCSNWFQTALQRCDAQTALHCDTEASRSAMSSVHLLAFWLAPSDDIADRCVCAHLVVYRYLPPILPRERGRAKSKMRHASCAIRLVKVGRRPDDKIGAQQQRMVGRYAVGRRGGDSFLIFER